MMEWWAHLVRVIVNVSRWIMNLGFRIAEQCEKEHKRKNIDIIVLFLI